MTLSRAVFASMALVSAACSPSKSAPAAAPDLTPASGIAIAAPSVTFEGVVITAGDRVRIAKRAGTFKPGDTGHPVEVEAGPGRTGLALGGVVRDPDYAQPGEPLQLVLVRFDPQTWPAWTGEAPGEAALPAFEATIHADFLAVIR